MRSRPLRDDATRYIYLNLSSSRHNFTLHYTLQFLAECLHRKVDSLSDPDTVLDPGFHPLIEVNKTCIGKCHENTIQPTIHQRKTYSSLMKWTPTQHWDDTPDYCASMQRVTDKVRSFLGTQVTSNSYNMGRTGEAQNQSSGLCERQCLPRWSTGRSELHTVPNPTPSLCRMPRYRLQWVIPIKVIDVEKSNLLALGGKIPLQRDLREDMVADFFRDQLFQLYFYELLTTL